MKTKTKLKLVVVLNYILVFGIIVFATEGIAAYIMIFLLVLITIILREILQDIYK